MMYQFTVVGISPGAQVVSYSRTVVWSYEQPKEAIVVRSSQPKEVILVRGSYRRKVRQNGTANVSKVWTFLAFAVTDEVGVFICGTATTLQHEAWRLIVSE